MITRASASEDSFEELYQEAPCGYISTLPEGAIIRVNRTFLSWTGYSERELCAGKRFPELLTVPGALLYETHCATLLNLRGFISEIALDLRCRDGKLLPVLFSAGTKKDSSGAPCLTRIVVFNAPTRREYERELLRARTRAEEAAEQVRIHHELAARKMAEQDMLLHAVARMSGGDLNTPVPIDPGSSLAALSSGLDRMRQDILGQIRQLKERNEEIQQLNRELRHQIEQRSRLLIDAMVSKVDYSASEVLPIFPSGTLLTDRYRIQDILGQGAMGTVYSVERLADGRRFAAKVLGVKPDYQAMARFAREAQLLARLHHPNVISIVDADVTEDRVAYIVMELAHGKSLAELSTRYGDRDFMLPLLLQIVDVLSAVHAAGVVHRDLKPSNVLISLGQDGALPTAKLVDFGISRLLNSTDEETAAAAEDRVLVTSPNTGVPPQLELTQRIPDISSLTRARPHEALQPTLVEQAVVASITSPRIEMALLPSSRPPTDPGGRKRRSGPTDELTQGGVLLGTPLYMAPELARGSRLARPPSDIFSFGVMAYEVLTGTLPFDKWPLFYVECGARELPFKPIDALCPGLSPALSRALETCLAMDPACRPTARELSAAFASSSLSQ